MDPGWEEEICRKQISSAKGKDKDFEFFFFFFLLKAKGATEGFLSREVTRVHMNFRLICQAEVGKQQKRASVGRSGRLWWNKGGGGGSELRQ